MSALDEELKLALTTPSGHEYDGGFKEIPWSGNPNPNAKENKTRRTKVYSHTDSRGRPATAGLFKGRVRRNRVHPIACRKINVEPVDSTSVASTWAKPKSHFFKSATLPDEPRLDQDDENNTPESTR